MSKLIFYACSAVVGQVIGKRQCRVWLEDSQKPSYDPGNLINVDLALSPGVLAPVEWSKVKVDDHVGSGGGGTTIGPELPLGKLQGGIYLVESEWQRCRDMHKIMWPPANVPMMVPRPIETYEFQSLLYRDDASQRLRRYHGFHAVALKLQGQFAFVQVFESASFEPRGPWWVELDDPEMCDPSGNGHTKIGSSGSMEGALFLSWETAAQFSLRMPKLPPSEGDRGFPRPALSAPVSSPARAAATAA
jgi:hypothetical protein